MPLITITHDIGCDGPAIGTQVARGLGLEYYDDAMLQQVAERLSIVKQADGLTGEKAPGLLDRLLSNRPRLYLDVMDAVIYEVAKSGQGVISGHGGQFLLRDFGCAFHVKIQAGEATRIKRIMDQRGINAKAAAALVKEADEQKIGYYRYAYKLNPDSPELYDLIINQEKIDVDGSAKIIVDSARIDSLASCSLNAREAMDGLSLEKRIHAGLLKDGIDLSTIEINVADGGRVRVYGMAATQEQRDRLPGIIAATQGVTKVDSQVDMWVYSI